MQNQSERMLSPVQIKDQPSSPLHFKKSDESGHELGHKTAPAIIQTLGNQDGLTIRNHQDSLPSEGMLDLLILAKVATVISDFSLSRMIQTPWVTLPFTGISAKLNLSMIP